MKKVIKNFLDKLSQANQKEFGNKTLDCCGLNKGPKGMMIDKNNMGNIKVKKG